MVMVIIIFMYNAYFCSAITGCAIHLTVMVQLITELQESKLCCHGISLKLKLCS